MKMVYHACTVMVFSVIRNHEKSGLKTWDVPRGHITDILNFLIRQRNLYVPSANVDKECHFAHTYYDKMT